MTDTTQTTSTDQLSRIESARHWLPYLRDLESLREILSDEPLYPGIADRMVEIEDEIRSVKLRITNALEPIG